MSDLFHENVPLEFIETLFDTMEKAHWHTFQILTKRAERLAHLAPSLQWPNNIWMGVSVERQDCTFRVDHLRSVPAAVRFLSCEPLIGPLELDLAAIHWVIVGGESGPGARPMSIDWARSILLQCQQVGVPFFLKQLGGAYHKRGKDLAQLDGKLWHELPPAVWGSATEALVQSARVHIS
jgi:protein gp37